MMKSIAPILCTLLFLSCIAVKITEILAKDEYLCEEELRTHLQPDDVGRNRKYDNLNHDNLTLCTRNCSKDPLPRICYYIFNVETYSAMGAACRNCPNNTDDCNRRQCVHADGIERMVVTINRMLPAPSIDVCEGDRIVVDVVNKMSAAALTIHWHGMLQKDTPWMDGVPYVTQCPIQPNSEFRYDFPADTRGTLFYHAHTAYAQSNGLYGSLNVRTSKLEADPNRELQDGDLPSHTVVVSDWTHLPAEVSFPGYYKNKSHTPMFRPDGYLINGRGSYEDSVTVTKTPHSEFHVVSGKRYRFRIVSAATSTCSFKFGVEDHVLQVVALDGYPCEPFNVSTLVMSSGQRTDVILLPKKTCTMNTTYLMVVKGMDSACENTTKAQTAYLMYDKSLSKPKKSQSELALIHEAKPFMNNHQMKCTNNPDNICADSKPAHWLYVSSQRGENNNCTGRNWTRLGISPSLIKLDVNDLFETNSYHHFFMPDGEDRGPYSTGLNRASSMYPPAPLLTQRDDIPKDFKFCRYSNESEPFRRCLYLIEIDLNTMVKIEFNGSGNPVHPIHIHGHHFQVINNTYKPIDTAPGPILRDVVHIPLEGRATVQFCADNPGYWIMHCHFNVHLEGGMFLVFKVGDESQFKPPPTDFPKCGNYKQRVKRIVN